MTRALVFDSGVGGLSIVETIREMSPDWIVDYAADAGFFPYGIKTDDELKARLPELCAALVAEADPDILVIACNTASTLALEEVRARVSIPVVGTVPAIKPAAAQTQTGVVGVLATPGTVRRAYLDELEQEFAKGVTVLRHGSAGLVELAERHVRGQSLSQRRFDQAVSPLFQQPGGGDIDVVVLACTHFPLVRDQIAAACPHHVRILIDTGEAIARQAQRVAPVTSTGSGAGSPIAYLTGGRANKAAYAPAFRRHGFEQMCVVDI